MPKHAALFLLIWCAGLVACATLDDYRLEDGSFDAARLYARRCSGCHDAFAPTDYTADDWPAYVERYGPRAGLTPEARSAVLSYLLKACDQR